MNRFNENLIYLFQMMADSKYSPNSFNMWQIKLILKQVFNGNMETNLISKETALSLQEEMRNYFEKWEEISKIPLKKYLQGNDFHVGLDSFALQMLSCYSVFFDLPYNINNRQKNILEIFVQLQSSCLSSDTITKITTICDILC